MQFEKSSFQFLNNLKKNNNRDWFAVHKEGYIQAQQNAKDLFQEINENLQKHDEIEKSKISPGNQLKHYSPNKPIRINVEPVTLFCHNIFFGSDRNDFDISASMT